MTANSPPYALQAGSHSAQLFRQAISTLLAAQGGVVGASDYAVTQNGTPNMSVNIAGGAPGSGGGIWVPGTTSIGVQGLYYGYNDATVNLAVAASNPTNPRIDTPIAQVQDAAYAGATNSFSLAMVTGTAAASPVAPSLPASSLPLANLAIAANATTVVNANITDRRSQASLGMTQNHASLGGGGSVLIPGAQATASATYTLLGTPDQVSNVVMPAGGLMKIAYQAGYVCSGTVTIKAAIFLNGIQLQYAAGFGASLSLSEATANPAAGRGAAISTGPNGLVFSTGISVANPPADATTGQILTSGSTGASGSVPISGGETTVFCAPGTYAVDVRFNVAGGSTLTVSGRRLYVWIERFA